MIALTLWNPWASALMRDMLTLTARFMSLIRAAMFALPCARSSCSSSISRRNCSRMVTACVTMAAFRTGSPDPRRTFRLARPTKTSAMTMPIIATVIGYLGRCGGRLPWPPSAAVSLNKIRGI